MARKRYSCTRFETNVCQRVINPGDRYLRVCADIAFCAACGADLASFLRSIVCEKGDTNADL